MLKIEGKTFMNIQEAVQWLLDNNALPFQSSANYVANTEIGMGTIVNPSPAKVRIGSLIFFADSKVSTVTGLTENGFIVSDQYNDLVDDVVYVSNVAINASGHLIVTLSNGDDIDAGLIKQISSFSIDASQHLIATFNNGTSQDLGAIFSGNITISGNLNVTGRVDANDIHASLFSGLSVTADSIVENNDGYSFAMPSDTDIDTVYASVVKTGNKITFVIFGNITPTTDRTSGDGQIVIGGFYIPSAIGAKLYPYTQSWMTNVLHCQSLKAYNGSVTGKLVDAYVLKSSGTYLQFFIYPSENVTLLAGQKYIYRMEVTFLLSDALNS